MLSSKNFWLGPAEDIEGHQVIEHGKLGEVYAVVVGVEQDPLGCDTIRHMVLRELGFSMAKITFIKPRTLIAVLVLLHE